MIKANTEKVKALMNNIVTLGGWYDQPLHCPFCGQAVDELEGTICKHLLYSVVEGQFVFVSDRMAEVLKLSEDKFSDSGWDVRSLGTHEAVRSKLSDLLPNWVEFQIDIISDTAYIGFACLEKELVGWGLVHQSPYAQD